MNVLIYKTKNRFEAFMGMAMRCNEILQLHLRFVQNYLTSTISRPFFRHSRENGNLLRTMQKMPHQVRHDGVRIEMKKI